MERNRKQLIQDVLNRVYGNLPKAEELSISEWEALSPEAQGRVTANYLQRIEEDGGEVAPQLKQLISQNKFSQLAETMLEAIWRGRKDRAESLIEAGTPSGFKGLNPEEKEAYINNVAHLLVDTGRID